MSETNTITGSWCWPEMKVDGRIIMAPVRGRIIGNASGYNVETQIIVPVQMPDGSTEGRWEALEAPQPLSVPPGLSAEELNAAVEELCLQGAEFLLRKLAAIDKERGPAAVAEGRAFTSRREILLRLCPERPATDEDTIDSLESWSMLWRNGPAGEA